MHSPARDLDFWLVLTCACVLIVGCVGDPSGRRCSDDSECPTGTLCDIPLGECYRPMATSGTSDATSDATTDDASLMLCGESGAACAPERCCPTALGLACVNLASDPQNCGACGVGCGTASLCVEGACVCALDRADCDLEVANGCEASLLDDTANCGGCGIMCTQAETCAEGVCVCGETVCGDGEICCGEACVDLSTDPDHCGLCNSACGSGERCADGQCTCGPTRAASGVACAQPGEACCQDQCLDETLPFCLCGGAMCATSERCCSSGGDEACVDVKSNPASCGGCGLRCEEGTVCQDGVCG